MGRIVVTQPPLSDNAALHYARSIAAGARAGDAHSQTNGGGSTPNGVFVALAANGGSDSNTGGISDPFLTFSAAQAAVGVGENIYYRAGTYTTTSQFINYSRALNGAGGERITIKPWDDDGNGSVIFDNGGRSGCCVQLLGSGAIVEGFEIRNSNIDGPAGGIQPDQASTGGVFISGSYHTVRYCWLHNFQGSFTGNAGSMRLGAPGATNCTIHNNAFSDLRQRPGDTPSTNVSHIIAFGGGGNTIHSNYQQLGNAGGGEAFIRQKQFATQANNRCYNNCLESLDDAREGIEMCSDSFPWQIDHNLLINARIGANHEVAVNNVIEYNTSYSTEVSLLHYAKNGAAFPNTIRRNIFYATPTSWSGFGIVRYNNDGSDTQYNTAIVQDLWENNCYFNPNIAPIIAYFAGGGAGGGNFTLAQFQALGQDAGSVVADPQFTNIATRDFHVGNASVQDRGCYQTGFDPPRSITAATGW